MRLSGVRKAQWNHRVRRPIIGLRARAPHVVVAAGRASGRELLVWGVGDGAGTTDSIIGSARRARRRARWQGTSGWPMEARVYAAYRTVVAASTE